MKYGSVCSGIEAVTVAVEPLGWEAVYYAEIDAFCSRLLQAKYPSVPNVGDFTRLVHGKRSPPAIDLLVGGTPCQSFSIAGLRGGLGDDRGNLALEFLRLAGRSRPFWVLWENVPGVLSSLSHDAPDALPPADDLGGDAGPQVGETRVVEDEYDADESHAFGCFVSGLSELGYGVAWRVLDAQFFGVAQRRNRMFVVGCLGGWAAAAAVLFDRAGMRGDPAPSRAQGSDVAGTLGGGSAQGGFGFDLDRTGAFIPVEDPAPTLLAQGNETGGPRPPGTTVDTAGTLLVRAPSPELKLARLRAFGDYELDEHASTMLSRDHKYATDLVFDAAQITSPANRANPKPGDPAPSMAATSQLMAFSVVPESGQGADLRASQVDAAPALTTEEAKTQDRGTRVVTPRGLVRRLTPRGLVRRLTPRECERLQGFPSVVELEVDQMTRDELCVALLLEGAVKVDVDRGEVFRLRGPGGAPLREPELLAGSNVNGYATANLSLNGTKKQIRLHRLVWIAKHGVPEDGKVVDHINGDKRDNRVANLQLLSGAQNSTKAAEEGRYAADDHPRTKLPLEVRRQLFHDVSGGGSYSQLAEKYGISKGRVGQIVRESDYTLIEGASDSSRYKALGNTMAVPVIRWLARRIEMVDQILKQREQTK